jgi:hypothetical protein
LKSSEPVEGELFRVRVTETREDVLEVMDLARGDKRREFPVKLQLAKGKHHLKRKRSTTIASDKRLCTYDVPFAGKLPNLTFRIEVPDDMPPGPKRKLLETLSKVPQTVEHEIVPATEALKPLAEKLVFQTEGDATWVFSTESDYGTPAFEHEFEQCARKIVDECSDLFFVNVLFPHLAAAITEHRLEDVK